MNEDEILELTYRSPHIKVMTKQEKIDALQKLKLEVMARNPTGLFIAAPTISKTPVISDPDVFSPRKGIVTKYGKKLLNEGAKYYKKVGG